LLDCGNSFQLFEELLSYILQRLYHFIFPSAMHMTSIFSTSLFLSALNFRFLEQECNFFKNCQINGYKVVSDVFYLNFGND
jgi:hypothetical protein